MSDEQTGSGRDPQPAPMGKPFREGAKPTPRPQPPPPPAPKK